MKNVTKKMVSAVLILSLLLSYGSFAQAKAAIKLSKSTVKLEVGKKATLELKDAKGKKIKAGKIKWSSTDKKIAKVSPKGVVIGVKAGTAKVIAKYKAKKYTCKIIVKANSPASGVCPYCNGGKKCTLCHGLGYYTTVGGMQICASCGGTGVCHYCDGTGIQKTDDWSDDVLPTDAPPTDVPSTDAPSTDAPSTDVPSSDAPPTDETKPVSEYSVKASDGTTITAKRGQTAIHSYQSYPGKNRSDIKMYLPNFESYTGGEFVVHSEEKYQDEWSMGYRYDGLNGYVPVPCYRTDYIMPFGDGIEWMDEYKTMLTGLGFKVTETETGPLSEEYYLRYQGPESITGDICCTYNSMAGICIKYDMYISVVQIGTNATMVTFEYPVEFGFEMDSVKAITQDTSVASTYFPAGNRTFFAFGGNMTVGEYVGIEVNKSKLKKGAVFTHSDLAKESEKEDGNCKLVLKNTYRVSQECTNLYPSSDKVEDAEIKVLAADSKNVAFYFKMKFVGHASHTFVFEGIASGVPADVPVDSVKVPAKVTLHDVCTKCYGKKLCPVCHGKKGMSYNTWGQGGSGWVNCAGCKGTGKCWKCGGSGK